MPTLINVCGPSYSGTTMLDLMLGNDPLAFSCGEVYAWYRPNRDYHAVIDCPCGQDPCPFWSKLLISPEQTFHREAFQTLSCDALIDSSKNLPWILDNNRWAARSGIDVRHVLVWKTPRAHAYSHWKRGTSLDVALLRYVRYYRRFFSLGLPFVAVNQERFAASPAESLRDLCALLNRPHRPDQHEFWKATHHNLFGNDGTRRQVHRGTSTRRDASSFPDEFLEQFQAFEARTADPRVPQIIDRLERRDLSRLEPDDLAAPIHLGLWRPSWYLADLWKRRFRQVSAVWKGRSRTPGRRFFSPELPDWRRAEEAHASSPQGPHEPLTVRGTDRQSQ